MSNTENLHASIVHGLRNQGWPREDAIEEADRRVSEAEKRRAEREAALRTSQDKGEPANG